MEGAEPAQPLYPKLILEEPEQASADSAEAPFNGKPSLAGEPDEKLQSQEEEQPQTTETPCADEEPDAPTVPASSPVQLLGNDSPGKSATPSSPPRPQPIQPDVPPADQQVEIGSAHEVDMADDDDANVTRSPSDGSSPIRPLVRKSSLNFASLPAREPLTSNKSLGARMSRTSHIDQTRTSYYPRQTGGKSLGVRKDAADDDDDAMEVDDDATDPAGKKDSAFATQNKSYTQRLQDQISMLGKSQTGGTRPSKSIANLAGAQQSLHDSHAQSSQQAHPISDEKPQSPSQSQPSARTPGAFPQDDEDDWIAPPTMKQAISLSPRPPLGKSHTADIMEGVRGTGTLSGVDFNLPQGQLQESSPGSPQQSPRKPPLSRPGNFTLGHSKSISVPDLTQRGIFGSPPKQRALEKAVSVSNPLVDNSQDVEVPQAPKSPSRSFCESPLKHSALKQVKNKLSSILKGSKGLLASSAALSAEGKASLVNSPSVTKTQKQNESTESLVLGKEEEPLYPDLTKHMLDSQHSSTTFSPSKANSRKTRASTERERRDQKQKDKEDREAQRLADQMKKLEKAREKEKEKARVFSKEKQEKVAAEQPAAMPQEYGQTTRTPAPKSTNKPIRTSPRKAQAQREFEGRAAAETDDHDNADLDVDMAGVSSTKPAAPSIPRPTPGQSLKNREIKRPIKPVRDATVKSKQAPTLIRVNTSSQHPGFHPSNSALAGTLQDTLSNSQQQMKTKASQPSMQNKSSYQSLKSSVSSTTGRPKALELAEKRRQEEEKKAQRKRDLKAEMERKREEDRRQEEARREKERQRAAAEEEAKMHAARQAAIEKAKKTKAPPPAARSQPNGLPDYNTAREKAAVSRPPSRLAQSTTHRSQEDVSRPVNAVLSSNAKMSMKRPLQPESAEDGRPTGSRNGPSQQKEVKRMRLSHEFDPEEEMEIQSYGASIKGPPVRPSAGLKKVSCKPMTHAASAVHLPASKDQTNKPLLSSGYAPAPQGVTRDIFKPMVAPHHNKSSHPLEMTQVSKGPIPFASSQHAAGPSHKTPAKPAGVMAAKSAAKSATRSSPHFQNGDNIELPEIQTDDEDDEEDNDGEAKGLGVASWADTPELRRELMKQETIDPLQVFGPPAPLRLEEVFKNKDRWSKFRARGSSANWNGGDRLTEDEIRKDLAAREKMRRDGGWSYELDKHI